MGAMWALLIPNVNFPDAEIWVLFVHHFKTVEGFKVASKEVNKVINNDSPDTPNTSYCIMKPFYLWYIQL